MLTTVTYFEAEHRLILFDMLEDQTTVEFEGRSYTVRALTDWVYADIFIFVTADGIEMPFANIVENMSGGGKLTIVRSDIESARTDKETAERLLVHLVNVVGEVRFDVG